MGLQEPWPDQCLQPGTSGYLAKNGGNSGPAQRHWLTMNVYTHTELTEQTAAIAALPGPPAGEMRVVAG